MLPTAAGGVDDPGKKPVEVTEEIRIDAARVAGDDVNVVTHGDRGVEDHAVLTHRQRQVLTLIGKGRSTKEIAAGLRISELTVQQHLKSIFDKAGVRTRRELTAQVFGTHYKPRIRSGEPLAPDGFFRE